MRRTSPALGKRKLADVTPQVVQGFLNDLAGSGLSPATVRHTRAVLRSAFSQAENWNLIARNPAAGKRVSLPRVEAKDVPALTPQHAQAIVAAFKGHPLEGLIATALGTGLRIGELLGLRWQDIDLDGGALTVRFQLQRVNGKLTLTVPKSKQSRRTLAIGAGTVEALRAHRVRQMEARLLAGSNWQDAGFVFSSVVGTGLEATNVLRRFKAQLVAAGLPPMRLHDLRHGVASLMIAQGNDLRRVMEQLGHSQIALTANTYTHISQQLKRETADSLDRALYGSG